MLLLLYLTCSAQWKSPFIADSVYSANKIAAEHIVTKDFSGRGKTITRSLRYFDRSGKLLSDSSATHYYRGTLKGLRANASANRISTYHYENEKLALQYTRSLVRGDSLHTFTERTYHYHPNGNLMQAAVKHWTERSADTAFSREDYKYDTSDVVKITVHHTEPDNRETADEYVVESGKLIAHNTTHFYKGQARMVWETKAKREGSSLRIHSIRTRGEEVHFYTETCKLKDGRLRICRQRSQNGISVTKYIRTREGLVKKRVKIRNGIIREKMKVRFEYRSD